MSHLLGDAALNCCACGLECARSEQDPSVGIRTSQSGKQAIFDVVFNDIEFRVTIHFLGFMLCVNCRPEWGGFLRTIPDADFQRTPRLADAVGLQRMQPISKRRLRFVRTEVTDHRGSVSYPTDSRIRLNS